MKGQVISTHGNAHGLNGHVWERHPECLPDSIGRGRLIDLIRMYYYFPVNLPLQGEKEVS